MGIAKKTEAKPSERPQNKNLKRDAGPGRPKGQKNFKTLYREALVKLGAKLHVEPDDLELQIVETGVMKARKGDYSFYKDLMDRTHGQAVKSIDVTSGGKTMGELLDELEKNS